MNQPSLFQYPIEFDWDYGNSGKNLRKHGLSDTDCEDVFLSRPLVLSEDFDHSLSELRYRALGITRHYRKLAVFFTVREEKIRIISARDQNVKERNLYEKV